MTNNYQKLDHPDVLQLVFHPKQEQTLPDQNIVDHLFQVDTNVSIGARFHLTEADAPVILFFHGNGEIASDYDSIGPHFTGKNINFLAVDYRGYGVSQGVPTVSNMMEDALTIFRQTKEWLSANDYNGPLFVMGRSLGSASAIEIASVFQDQITGLLLDSSFAVTLPLLIALGLNPHTLGIKETDGFGNIQKISTITKPTYILHAQFDQIIPLDSAELLQSHCQAKNKQFQVIPGADHNNIIETVGDMYFTVIRQFIDKVLRIRPKRYVRREGRIGQ